MKLSLATALSAVSLSACVLVACTEANPPPRAADSIRSAPPPSSCPLGVDGARVVYEDTEKGGRLTFTAPPAQIEDLRRRARDAAAMHGTGQQKGEGHDGRHGNGGEHGLRPMQLPPASAGEQDLEGGARIDVTPRYEGDLLVLRAKLRERAQELMASCD